MSTHLPGFQSFSINFAAICIGQIQVTSSIRVNPLLPGFITLKNKPEIPHPNVAGNCLEFLRYCKENARVSLKFLDTFFKGKA